MIHSLHIKNFQAHADTSIELSPTVTVITGESDQGKTSILRALRKILRNSPKGDFFIRWGQKTCQIAIDVDNTVITRKIGRKDGVNVYSVGDTNFSNFGVNVPEEVRIAMNISDVQNFEKEKIDLNIRTQHESLFLVGGTGVEALRGRVFGKITGSDKINKAATVLNSNIRNLKQEVDTLKRTKDEYYTEINKLEYITKVQDSILAIKELISNVESHQLLINNLNRIHSVLLQVKKDGTLLSNKLTILKSIDCKNIEDKCIRFDRLVKLFNNLVNIESDISKLEPISTLSTKFDVKSVEDLVSTIFKLWQLDQKRIVIEQEEVTTISKLELFTQQLHDAEIELEAVKAEIGFCPLCERPFEGTHAH